MPLDEFLIQIKAHPEVYSAIKFSALVGRAFISISLFEEQFSLYLFMLDGPHLSDGSSDIEKNESFGKRLTRLFRLPLGALREKLLSSGLRRRDALYLERIVGIRNDFIHRFGKMVPYPGDWERYEIEGDRACEYPYWVEKRVEFARQILTHIFVANGHIKVGAKGEWGALLYPSDFFERLGVIDE